MMLNWIIANIADAAVCALIILICAIIIVNELIKRRHMKATGGCCSSCGYCSGGCAGCSMHQHSQSK